VARRQQVLCCGANARWTCHIDLQHMSSRLLEQMRSAPARLVLCTWQQSYRACSSSYQSHTGASVSTCKLAIQCDQYDIRKICHCQIMTLQVHTWACGRRFHAVGYEHRIIGTAVLMSSSYVTIAASSTRPWQLLGVALGSLQASRCLRSTDQHVLHARGCASSMIRV
jgi:hypothetical protein